MSRLRKLLSQAERIGVLGSPSSTSKITLDILAPAVTRKLVGEFTLFTFDQDGLPHFALGQITEVVLRNPWHEDPTIRSLIRQRGAVQAVSERQDTHQGEIVISAVFAEEEDGRYRPSLLATVPATGTPVHLVTDEMLRLLLVPYQDQLFYLGYIYGSKPLLPLWFKHFASGRYGAGEAYHLGIFGKTGSGKSVLAKMILLAYARYPHMALLVLDPQGEFAKDLQDKPTGAFRLPMREILQKLGKPFQVLGVRDLILDRWELFEQILYESPFFERLSIPKGENRRLACQEISERLQKANIKLVELHTRENFERVWRWLGQKEVQTIFYRSETSRERFARMWQGADPEEFYRSYWLPVARLFQKRPGAQTVESALKRVFDPSQTPRPLLVIDLSEEQVVSGAPAPQQPSLFSAQKENTASSEPLHRDLFWNETIQALVIKRILSGLRIAAESAFKTGKSLNTLVLIDEAHRLAPRERPENEEAQAIRDMLVDAVRTTRKYGIGWMFISQTLSSLHRGILDQIRIFFFGFGLSMGQEWRTLSELVGGVDNALALYKSFRDPHSTFDISSREYAFMTVGPVSPLSFAGTPLFFTAFNTPEAFLRNNSWKPLQET